MRHITKGSVFDALERDPGEAVKLKVKAALFDVLIAYIEEHKLTQQEAADRMGVQRSRVGDLMRGQISRFSIDALVVMAGRVGIDPIKAAA